ncbi:antibiotic biosynthesis monooxygenase family protein [Umezawaea tangerina]|uniref:Antibiotic biosynthesis monooxygenase n=1 Tax=Umezawaea tangerina TaxID=84725 RepID=A0A2T0T7R9_9PSEU|nr:antibiotic biosynthesis monooxygenase [Umezawaea tangerina]PRY41691.1 antibiotic biosynthesis monooxygenase [Umezawaea tangerina]
MEATLINVFIVPAEREAEFLEHWERTSAIFRKGGALLEAHLHRNTDAGDSTFRYINIARWTSGEAWRKAHQEHLPTEYDIPGVKGHPSIFEAQRHIYAEGAPVAADTGHWIATPARG